MNTEQIVPITMPVVFIALENELPKASERIFAVLSRRRERDSQTGGFVRR